MKLGIVGKGGVGKTTIAALLADTYASKGRRVVAIDTDSNPNLGFSLGLTAEQTDAVRPLPRSVIVGTRGDLSVGDVFDDYGRTTPAGVTLLSAIKVTHAAGGCTCGGHATVRSLLAEALDDHTDVTLIDMEAGLEHLSRSGGTLAHADILLVIMEPSRKAIMTAVRTAELAAELGIPSVLGLGNKAADPGDADFFRQLCAEQGVPLAGIIPYDSDIANANRASTRVDLHQAHAVREELDRVVVLLDEVLAADHGHA